MASYSEESAHPSNSKWSNADIDLARYSLGIASTIMCVAAVVLLVHKKLHKSLSYRLILYLLIASMINSVTDTLQIPFYWYRPGGLDSNLELFCQVLGYMEVYCSWNLSLVIFYINVEIFVMVTYNHQLTKLEIPCTATCFILPCFIAAVPFSTNSYALVDHFCGLKQNNNEEGNDTDQAQFYVWYVPGLMIACTSVIIIIVAVLKLAYKLYQMKSLGNSESEELLHNRDQDRHSKALKETIPLAIYSMTLLALLITDILSLSDSNSKTLRDVSYVSNILTGCIGGSSAGIFFIQFCIKFYCPKKRSCMEQAEIPQPVNISSSDGGYHSTFYTAEDQAEESK